MTRWSINNRLSPVTYDEFKTLTASFKRATEASFGTECRLEVKAYAAHKLTSSFWDPEEQDALDRINEANRIGENGEMISREIWDRARYVEAILHPVDPRQAPQSAFAHAEFKGVQPLKASFYIQPDGEDVRTAMLAKTGITKSIGDGHSSNSILNGRRPQGLLNILRSLF